MSIKLIAVLFVLMIANQLVGISYGAFKDGFSWSKLKYGAWKLLTTLGGYAAIAFAAHYANDYINGIEYISGILLEPIAKYFLNVVEKLKQIMNEDISTVIRNKSINNKISSDNPEYFAIHSFPASTSK
ncbi:MAG: hypothetical protein GXY01_10590 [Clostridiales bacterium]|nr:hypothetical protein [Clostridiales bacterium]